MPRHRVSMTIIASDKTFPLAKGEAATLPCYDAVNDRNFHDPGCKREGSCWISGWCDQEAESCP